MSSTARLSSVLASPTVVALVINVVIYLLMVLAGGRSELAGPSTETLMRFGADYGPLVRQGQVHRLLASCFLHLNAWHLLLNSAALVSVGPRAEAAFGRGRFTALYLVSGVAGAAVSLVANAHAPVVSAGASGALCGIIAAVAVALLRLGSAGRPELGRMLLWLGMTLIFGVVVRADNAAHLGGMLAGAVLARVLANPRTAVSGSLKPAATMALAALLSFAGAVHFRARSQTAAQLVNAGVDLARADDDEGARDHYERALALEPDDAVAHFDLGLALTRLERYPEAIQHLQRALELEALDSHRSALVAAHINFGVSLAKEGKSAAAEEQYRHAIELDDSKATAFYDLGLELERQGRLADALHAFERAAQLEPKRLHQSAVEETRARLGASKAGVTTPGH
ncbi:MAG: rhomboid family intramembrane serine protease [Polyangiaceae bacterium]